MMAVHSASALVCTMKDDRVSRNTVLLGAGLTGVTARSALADRPESINKDETNRA